MCGSPEERNKNSQRNKKYELSGKIDRRGNVQPRAEKSVVPHNNNLQVKEKRSLNTCINNVLAIHKQGSATDFLRIMFFTGVFKG